MTTTIIDKAYDPEAIEQHWYQTWEKNGLFAPSGKGHPYCIMLPPPNVTGSLHMGHGFGFTLIDVLIRYHRMCGDNTLWQPGTDHAGIATQMVVERQLNHTGKTRHDLGRDTFVEKVWAWKQESGDTITRQLRRLGASPDWQHERFTMDPELSEAVRDVFIRLYDEGLIYRGKRLVNWDPVLLTAISDLEVTNEEVKGHLWHIRYPLVEGNAYVIVATTRPETLLGDVAVAVHPDDERYQHLIGKHLALPLTDRTIPIIADTYVDPLFGTGCVKITPAHDFNDYAVGIRHGFTPINILTPTAHLNEHAPLAYQGMERFQARERIVKDLTAQGLIDKIEPHTLKVPRGDRSHTIIEPYLTYQWYVKSKPLAEPAIHAVESGAIRFIPENWNKTYFQWMNNIEDWCISRQLWWGHRIPVWYDDQGNHYVGRDEHDVRKRNQLAEALVLTQDEDVLDTWFSSALWPFSSLGWPNDTARLKTFFPTSTLVTGFDIIFFWVARMIMMSLKFTGQVPFRDVYITGLVRDADGHKMSKSKGNVLDPIDLIDGIDLASLVRKRLHGLMQPAMAEKIEKHTRKEFPAGIPNYGTDALRFTFCSMASYTREIRFDMSRLGGYRHFCNKLWNASRYVMMNTTPTPAESDATAALTLSDRWIRSRLQTTIEEAHAAIKQYRFDIYAQVIYDFTWNEFCDWYLELSKAILNAPDTTPDYLKGTRHTLVTILETLLRLLHPIMPFITEEIWQRIAPLLWEEGGKQSKSIMLAPYPEKNDQHCDQAAEQEIDWIKKVVMAIRTLRSDLNLPPKKPLSLVYRHGTKQDQARLNIHSLLLTSLAKLENMRPLLQAAPPASSASTFIGDLEVFLSLETEPLNEKDALAKEAKRQKEMEALRKDLTQLDQKLQNPAFKQNAPADVVAKTEQRRKEVRAMLEKLSGRR